MIALLHYAARRHLRRSNQRVESLLEHGGIERAFADSPPQLELNLSP